MKISEIIRDKKCKPLFDEVNSFCTDILSDYNDYLADIDEDVHAHDKDIFDFVWGTIELKSYEVFILDSPLLQRLRYIKQLGMADMLYCNANSSRFSHTIGVVEVSSRMATKVARALDIHYGDVNELKFREIVRLAALFHDVGHMFYSHVSEHFFSKEKSFPRYTMVKNARNHILECTKKECALHELISVMMVNSDAVGKMLSSDCISNAMLCRISNKQTLERVREYISALILGVAIDKAILPFSTIIKGSVDADRIDYLSRDSACTKVPISVDASRLIQKIMIEQHKSKKPEFTKCEVWDDDKSRIKDLFAGFAIDEYKMMVIKNSAAKVCFQLINARTNMYESVYKHHKVLTAETMMKEVLFDYFEQCGSKSIDVSFREILTWTDEVFSEYWNRIINTDGIDKKVVDDITERIKEIKNRKLYKRVASFAEKDLTSLTTPEIEGKDRFTEDIKYLRDRSKELFERFSVEYNKICKLLKKTVNSDANSKFVFVSPDFGSMDSIPIEDGNGTYIWSNDLYKKNTMEEGRKSKEDKYYLLANCLHREYAYLAFERVLYEEYQLIIGKQAAKCLKSDYTSISKYQEELFKKNYYRDCLYLIGKDLFLENIDEELLDRVVLKYSTFSSTDGRRVNRESVVNFLLQFRYLPIDYERIAKLLNGILRLLDGGYYIDREMFTTAFKDSWFKDSSDSHIHMCCVGGLMDSSPQYGYYLNDVKRFTKKQKLVLSPEKELSECLKSTKPGDVIYFYDDGAYSGKQIISIFQEYMGIPIEERLTSEEHVKPLKKRDREKLKARKICLLFVLCNSKNKQYIIKEFKHLGLDCVDIRYLLDMNKSAFNQILTGRVQREAVKENLSVVGKCLLECNKKGHARWDEKRLAEAVLGYNNSQQIVIGQNNTPTYTVPAFWMDGTVNNRPWKALFTRKKED